MPEQQDIEYKSAWHDDYLKWICGFANAQGGTIYIGKDDNGNVVGINDYKKLMDDIPNKIRNCMGITVEVNLHEENEMYSLKLLHRLIPFLSHYVVDTTTVSEAPNRN